MKHRSTGGNNTFLWFTVHWFGPLGYCNLHRADIELEVDDASNRHIEGLAEDPVTIFTPL